VKVKHFYGHSVGDVMQEIKRELGREAVILESRPADPAAGRPQVEVVAAVDFAAASPADFAAASWTPAAGKTPPAAGREPGGELPAYRELRQEVLLIRQTLDRLLGATGLEGEWPAAGPLGNLYRRLLAHGLPAEVGRELLDRVLALLPGNRPVPGEIACGCLARTIIDRLELLSAGDLGRRITLVGPTGVGKTTTAAKLAAYFQQRGEKVGLVTVDAFRLGAAAQIREYGRRLRVPVRTAFNRADLEKVLRAYAACDRIIVDTTGRSHRDAAGLEQLAGIVGGSRGAGSTLLVVPVGVREDDFLDILVSFRRFASQGLLFSKLDESTAHGMLYHGGRLASLPLTFFTTGQRVPEDLEPATGERVAALLLDLDDAAAAGRFRDGQP